VLDVEAAQIGPPAHVEVVAYEGQLMTSITIERRPLGWMYAEL
jgi:hypothetical protein